MLCCKTTPLYPIKHPPFLRWYIHCLIIIIVIIISKWVDCFWESDCNCIELILILLCLSLCLSLHPSRSHGTILLLCHLPPSHRRLFVTTTYCDVLIIVVISLSVSLVINHRRRRLCLRYSECLPHYLSGRFLTLPLVYYCVATGWLLVVNRMYRCPLLMRLLLLLMLIYAPLLLLVVAHIDIICTLHLEWWKQCR